jgi:hypothetical protein
MNSRDARFNRWLEGHFLASFDAVAPQKVSLISEASAGNTVGMRMWVI